ncbi:MAG TPA: thiamine phosphate synthase [Candidatus Polarisedimenticolia bacterium]|nr:thiamine phosphate synthase [Candidatus Polarisedimenticolia bacterium]
MTSGWPRYHLYVLTDVTLVPGRTHTDIVRAALAGGADAVQIRDKATTAQNLGRAVAECQPLARKFGAALLVNDRVDVALLAGADGAHVGPEDLPARAARRLLKRPALLGVSAGTLEEAKKAVRDGADYLGVGPIFGSRTKPDAGPPLGLEPLEAIVRAVQVPVVAIGGIDHENVAAVAATGCAGAAVIAAVVTAPDMAAAARAIKTRFLEGRRAITGGAGPR